MARPKRNPQKDFTSQVPVPRLRRTFSRVPFYLPKEASEEVREWLPALVTMQYQSAPPVLLVPVEEYQLTGGECILHYSCHYIIKAKWDKYHPLPPYPNQAKSLLSYFAKTWLCILELCIQCRDFLPVPELQKFLRASDWFRAIIQEERVGGLKMIRSNHENYSRKYAQPHLEPKQPDKREIVSEMRAFLKEIKALKNPYCKEEDPQMWRLFDVAQKLSKNSPDFKKRYWQPYIKANSNLIQVIESDSRVHVVQERDGYPITHFSTRSITPLGDHLFSTNRR